MLEFPMWITGIDGQDYFLTDEQIVESAGGIVPIEYDNIRSYYYIEDGIEYKGYPCPTGVTVAILDGKMSNSALVCGYVEIHLNEKGELHREDGPAIIYANGDKEYWYQNMHHRLDGPAIERIDGTQIWIVEDRFHREDGPAIIYANGQKEYWIEDIRAGTDGKVVEYLDGTVDYWIDGVFISTTRSG